MNNTKPRTRIVEDLEELLDRADQLGVSLTVDLQGQTFFGNRGTHQAQRHTIQNGKFQGDGHPFIHNFQIKGTVIRNI